MGGIAEMVTPDRLANISCRLLSVAAFGGSTEDVTETFTTCWVWIN